MARSNLLDEVIALPYDARYRRLREAGAESRSSATLARVFDQWEHGDWQERLYCAQSCTGSGDAARLRRMIDDPSRAVANLALKLLAVFGGDDVLVEVLMKVTRPRRRRLLARLRSRRRYAVIDRFLDEGFARAIPRLAELLPYGSAQAVTLHFLKGESAGGSLFWQRLARFHPQLATQAMLDRLNAADEPDALLLSHAQNVVLYAARREPERVARLVAVAARFRPLASMHRAVCRRPNDLAEVVLASENYAPFTLAEVVHKLDHPLVLKILREQPALLPMQANWFRKLPVIVRVAAFDVVGRSWRNADGLIAADLLALLPTPLRVVEAERMTALAIMATRPQVRATYAAYLSWTKMREIADGFLTHPEGESRGWGWIAILTSLRYHRDQASSVLAMIRKRKFEQDPVRMVILQHLTTLPAGMWQEAHLDDIAGIVREALDATDLSYTSAIYATAFVQKLIPTHPQWAANQLALIYRERGNIGGYFLETRINDAQALTLEAAFLDVGKSWGKGNRVGWLLWFASALGRRLRVCSRLLKMLEQLLGKESGVYDTSIVLMLKKHLPFAEFERIVERLIGGHESWVAIQPIFLFLHRHRQDWLEPFLSKRKFHMKGDTYVELVSVLPAGGYGRYTLTQQARLAKTLNGIIRLPAKDTLPIDVWTMLRAMNFLAMLPAVDADRLIELSNDKRPVIADSATRALGRLDAGQGLPTLLVALGDQRARVAIYALRRAMTEMPAQRVLADLRDAPMNKVTVAKEIVRLVAEFAGPEGFEWLLATTRQELHRDVRIAVLRGLWDHLEHPETWNLLAGAAESADGQILNGVVRIPVDRLSDKSRRKLIDLLVGLAAHADALIRLAVLQRFIDLPLPDREGRLMQSALAALSAKSPDERALAARVVAANATADDSTRIASAVAALSRRPLHDFIHALIAELQASAIRRRKMETPVRAILESLRADPVTAGLRWKLASASFSVEGFASELDALIDDNFPIAAVLAEANAAIAQIGQTPHRSKLASLKSRLASTEDPHLRLLAFVALTVQASDSQRWDDARRVRLDLYRNDASPIVAIRAQFYFEGEVS